MLLSFYDDLGPVESVLDKWQVGTPVLVEVDGQPVETTVTGVSRGSGPMTGVYVQVDLPVPLGTPVRIGRHRKL